MYTCKYQVYHENIARDVVDFLTLPPSQERLASHIMIKNIAKVKHPDDLKNPG